MFTVAVIEKRGSTGQKNFVDRALASIFNKGKNENELNYCMGVLSLKR